MRKEPVVHTPAEERGVALIAVLLFLALLLALIMGISLTSISELGVSRTYGTQTIALQAAEAGLNHGASLVYNYRGVTGDTTKLFNQLLRDRNNPQNNYLSGNNAFHPNYAANFQTGVQMIPYEDASKGFQLRDAVTGAVVPDVYYRVGLIDDEPSTSTAALKVPNFTPGTTYAESVSPFPDNPLYDKNNRLVLYSTGTYLNSSVTLEGWVGFLPYPALSANQNIEISGNAQISGAFGGVHSNMNLIESGNGWGIAQTATAVGQLQGSFSGQVGGFYGGGQARLYLPDLVTTKPLTTGGANTSPRVQDFLIRQADVILLDPGFADGAHGTDNNGNDSSGVGNAATRSLSSLAERLGIPYAQLVAAVDTNTSTNHVQQSQAIAIQVRSAGTISGTSVTPTRYANTTDVGWSYSNEANPWGIANNSASNHTFYVVGRDNYKNGPLANSNPSTPNGGNVKLTGSVGGNGSPLRVTIMATGSIAVNGNANIDSNLTDLSTPLLPPFVRLDILMVATEDIQVRGDFSASIAFTGISYAGEQVDLSSNGSINGQVIAYGNNNVNTSLVEGPVGDRNRNTVTGNFELTLNDGNSIGRIKLYSWRQIKQ